MKRKASSGIVIPAGTTGLERSTRSTRDEVLGLEVDVAEVALGPGAVFGERARQGALVERHARDHGDVRLAQAGNSSSSGFWSKML